MHSSRITSAFARRASGRTPSARPEGTKKLKRHRFVHGCRPVLRLHQPHHKEARPIVIAHFAGGRAIARHHDR